MRTGQIRLGRVSLYEMVWAEPVRTVAARYNVSDVAFAKICRTLGVPLPGRGYWAKKAAGVEVPARPPLPERAAGEPTDHELSSPPTSPARAPAPADAAALLEREREPANRIAVSDQLQRPHRLVAECAAAFKRETVRVNDGLRRALGRVLSVTISPAQLGRATRLLDALIKALESRGHAVEVTDPQRPPLDSWGRPRDGWPHTRTNILGEWAYFDLRESYRLEDPTPPPVAAKRRPQPAASLSATLGIREAVATGQLKLRVLDPDCSTAKQVWRDTPTRRLEDQLNAVVVGLVKAAVVVRERREHIATQEAAQRAAAARQEEQRRRAHEEALWVGDLESRVRDWQRARQIREFVAAVERNPVGSRGAAETDADVGRWVARARQHADRLEADAINTVLRRRGVEG
jgi:hypothetical protein